MADLGSTVRLKDGRVGVISKVTPLGTNDRILIEGSEEPVTSDDIQSIRSEEPVNIQNILRESGEALCQAKGTHKRWNFVRDVYCSLPEGHEGCHIAYWNHVITDNWVEGEKGEIGGPGGSESFDWSTREED